MNFLPLTPKRYGRQTGVDGRWLLTPVYCRLANSLCSPDQATETKLKAVK